MTEGRGEEAQKESVMQDEDGNEKEEKMEEVEEYTVPGQKKSHHWLFR